MALVQTVNPGRGAQYVPDDVGKRIRFPQANARFHPPFVTGSPEPHLDPWRSLATSRGGRQAPLRTTGDFERLGGAEGRSRPLPWRKCTVLFNAVPLSTPTPAPPPAPPKATSAAGPRQSTTTRSPGHSA